MIQLHRAIVPRDAAIAERHDVGDVVVEFVGLGEILTHAAGEGEQDAEDSFLHKLNPDAPWKLRLGCRCR